MFIQASAEYLPVKVVDNEHFSQLTNKPLDWFEQRTGIRQRHRAGTGENANTMAISAVENLLLTSPGALSGVDLIVGASYTPWDTIATIAHVVQRRFSLHRAKALYISTACTSFIEALDLATAYFRSHRATRALIVAVEHNSLYSSDADPKAGHLWGDGAAAVVIGSSQSGQSMQVIDVETVGLGDLGQGPEGIELTPSAQGLVMRSGNDIFMHACREMVSASERILERNGVALADVRLLVPHQANQRIIDCVMERLHFTPERVAMNITNTGNTGCASVAIAYHRHWQLLSPGEYAVLVTFGGGYSVGAALLRK